MEKWINKLQGDRVLWLIWAVFACISLLAVYSAIAALAYHKHQFDTEKFLFKQIWIIGSGFVFLYLLQHISYGFLWKWSSLIFICALAGLVLTLLFGVSINEARRWLQVPILGLSFQASDFAKMAGMIVLSKNLVKYPVDSMQDFLLKVLAPIFVLAFLILPANFSTAFLLVLHALLMSWMVGVRFGLIFKTTSFLMILSGLVLVFILYLAPHSFKRAATWKQRIENFSSPEKEESYQIQEAKTAIWHGGLLGKGPGKGHMRYTLPHPYSDMIFAFIIEEYGSLLGGAVVIFLYILIFFRSLKVAKNAKTEFGSLLALSISTALVLQAFVNMAVAVGIFPVTGQPLPLLSMGGTSIWFTCILMGILINISKESLPKNHLNS